MTSEPVPSTDLNAGALDDAALEVSGGGALQGSAPQPTFKRDKAWGQEGIDHTVGHMNAHAAGLPDGATNGLHAGAAVHGAKAEAYAGAGASHSFHGPGGLSADVNANSYAGAHAGPTGFGAAAGADSSITIHANNNLSFGTRAYAGAQAGAGVGPRGLNGIVDAGVGQESHIDAGVHGHLTGALSGGTNTHVEIGARAEAGGRASVGMENKLGANAYAGDYASVSQSGHLAAGGVKVEGEAGVITPGSAGAGMHVGAGVEGGNVKLNVGGSVSVLLGGLKIDGTITVPTKPIVDTAKTEGKAWQWAGEHTVKGVVIAADHTARGAKYASEQVVDFVGTAGGGFQSVGAHTAGAGRTVAGVFGSVGEHTADAARTAANGIANAGRTVGGGFQSAGEHTADVAKTAANGIADAGRTVGGGFESAGNSIAHFFSSW